MKKEKTSKALEDFLEEENQEEQSTSKNEKKVVFSEREGLIERVDKIFVTKDGRQLLREQY